ncbi:GD21049 [Drosophila simulans]|uniref:GD21049 n=1 Tax=Drosophila simulans TaxID=7240 RepID=B4QSD9_DROSI|nr:GD21049 [Drosophila simulans]
MQPSSPSLSPSSLSHRFCQQQQEKSEKHQQHQEQQQQQKEQQDQKEQSCHAHANRTPSVGTAALPQLASTPAPAAAA